jgi:protein-S-isoprenylcysteine O-methyltransferase Ste14
MMLIDHIILAFLWIIYCVLHSVFAATGVKEKIKRGMSKHYKYYRILYTIFSFLFLVAIIYFQLSLPTRQIFQLSAGIIIVGIIISFSGLWLMIICINKYFISLSGLRSLLQERISHELMISGIHRYVRHPLYLGTFAFIWGLFLLLPYISLLIANAIITVYTLIGIGLEEKKLVDEFGDSYLRYQSKVPKLIPLFRPKPGE